MSVKITYFSDVLCIWAYIAQARVDAVKQDFGTQVQLDYRFCSVFGDTQTKLTAAWRDRGGIAGYRAHVQSVADRFPHVTLHAAAWAEARPASSASPHLFLSAVSLLDQVTPSNAAAPSRFESVMGAFRRGFFSDGRDIAQWQVQCELAEPFGVDLDAVTQSIQNGSAFARLSTDYQDADKMRIEGSPTFVLNEERQKLFGNVGFRIIKVNIEEMLRDPNVDEASWC